MIRIQVDSRRLLERLGPAIVVTEWFDGATGVPSRHSHVEILGPARIVQDTSASRPRIYVETDSPIRTE